MSTTTTPPSTGTVGVQPAPSGRGRSGKQGSSVGDVAVSGFSHLFLLVWGAMVVLPLLWVVMSSFKTDAEIIKNPLSMIPDGLHWDNFSRAWSNGHFTDVFLDTVIIVGGGVFFTMLLGSMAAYVLARYEFPGNRIIYYLFLAGLTLPVYMAAVPLYKGIDNMGRIVPFLGHNQYVMLILVYVAWSLSFTVFFMHSFFRTLPSTVAEAGLVDGCSHSTLFFRVMLPMAKPGLISIGIFNVIGQWNQWYLPVLLMQPQSGEDKKAPIAQALIDLSVNQGYRSDWSGMFAGLTMAMLPVLAVYIIFQRQVQAGLTGSITK
ncbi:N-acetylglucosamine transport system permease protein [Asanoa hainanensis]|uniref:N-acetylglucosamine transport system permease protein n=1 Tax=Asanoa hainanensis TaxID=560556 RepID=A0A239P7E5_9ACTN|nr:N-acetylglucosamine transport system permease protein [Asanoa hainanensis]